MARPRPAKPPAPPKYSQSGKNPCPDPADNDAPAATPAHSHSGLIGVKLVPSRARRQPHLVALLQGPYGNGEANHPGSKHGNFSADNLAQERSAEKVTPPLGQRGRRWSWRLCSPSTPSRCGTSRSKTDQAALRRLRSATSAPIPVAISERPAGSGTGDGSVMNRPSRYNPTGMPTSA